jgi:hypothetical protein
LPSTGPTASTASGTAVLPVSQQISLQETAFNASRGRLVTGLPREMGQAVASVDRLDFDPARPTIVAQITSPLTVESALRDTAWAVTRALVVYWDLETVRRAPNAVPDLRISVNNLRVECPAGIMVRLGYGDASREQWAAECKLAG